MALENGGEENLRVEESALASTLRKWRPEERKTFRKSMRDFFFEDESQFEKWNEDFITQMCHEFFRLKFCGRCTLERDAHLVKEAIAKGVEDHCLQKLLVESPIDKISAVQLSVRNRFPFDSVWERNEDCQLSFKVVREKKLENGLIELEGEASCSSISTAKIGANNIDLIWKNEELAAGEGKFDVKGKGIARNRRQKVNLRRRRKNSTNHINSTANSSYDNVRPGAPVVPLSKHGSGNNGKVSSENSTPVDSHDCVEPSHVMELDDKLWLSSESNSVIDANKSADKDMVPLGSQRNDAGQYLEHGDQQENAIRILEQALEEERAARSALFFDLEKERIAVATAADEAMAMILRLQEEKAAIELEARQYERILEEKSSYDAEEMDVLKEIIVRREREKHFLEKEVESYKNLLQEEEQFEEDEDFNILDIQAETLLFPGEDENTIDFTDALPLIQCDDIPETAEQVDDSTVKLSQEFQEKGLISGASSGQLSMPRDHGYQEKSIVLIGELKNDLETESDEQYNVKCPGGNVVVEEELLYDIHVIDDNCASHEKDNAESSTSIPEVSMTLPPLSNSHYEDNVSEFRRHSIATVDHEREKLNHEVGCLRERLRSIQAGREKLNLTMEHRDKGETELQLLDDIANLLQEIRQLTEPQKTMRRTSLPPPGSKVKDSGLEDIVMTIEELRIGVKSQGTG